MPALVIAYTDWPGSTTCDRIDEKMMMLPRRATASSIAPDGLEHVEAAFQIDRDDAIEFVFEVLKDGFSDID